MTEEKAQRLHQIFDLCDAVKDLMNNANVDHCEIDLVGGVKLIPVYRPIQIWVEKPEKEEKPKGKQNIPDHIRWAVFERDNFTCKVCGSRRYLAVDHIVPESKGGPTTLENLQTLCKSCNSRKGAR